MSTPETDAGLGPAPASGRRRRVRARRPAVLLLRLESAWSRGLVLAVTLAGAAWLSTAILGPAVAERLERRAETLAELERGLAWSGGDPDLHLLLGQGFLRLDPPDLARARRHLGAALRSRPTHGWTWLQLAMLAEREGDPAGGRSALGAALRFDPHNVVLRWEAALGALGRGDRDGALEHLRYIVRVDPERRPAALQVARAVLPAGTSVATLLPHAAEPLTGVLHAAILQRDLALAQAAWERRAILAPAIDEVLQQRYLDLLLDQREGAAARRLWLAMTPDGHPADPRNAVWNGSFEAERLAGWGLDWRISRQWGVEVSLDRFRAVEGKQSLRLAFATVSVLDYAGVYQMVPVQPGREYRLRARARAANFATRSGLRLEVTTPDGTEVLAGTEPVAGTTPDWVTLDGRLLVPSGVSLVHLRLRRPPPLETEASLGGEVWIDDVSLTPTGHAFSLTPAGRQR